jgi:hypothetical protein
MRKIDVYFILFIIQTLVVVGLSFYIKEVKSENRDLKMVNSQQSFELTVRRNEIESLKSKLNQRNHESDHQAKN